MIATLVVQVFLLISAVSGLAVTLAGAFLGGPTDPMLWSDDDD